MPAKSLSGRRILVVEDEALIAMMIEDELADRGCEVVIAASIERAMTILAKDSFDAAVLDVNLNGKNSSGVADALAARGVPFIFSTGYVAAGARESEAGRPVLHKPFKGDELHRAITQVLA